MYGILRTVHLYAAMAVLLLVLMYCATGYLIVHPNVLSDVEPERTTRVEKLHYKGEREPEAYAAALQDSFGLRGQVQESQRLQDGSWRFRYVRPGTTHEALVNARGDSVVITRSRDGLRRTLVGFHRLHGFHGGLVYTLWSALYDLTASALIFLALTGVIMWHRLTRHRFLGWLVLLGGCGYAAATICYLMYAP